VRCLVARLPQRRLAARRGADEGDVGLRREQLGDRVAQQAVVLDQQTAICACTGGEEFL